MDQPTYRNFDLILERIDGGHRARIHDSPAGQSAWVNITLPFTDAELAAATTATWSATDSRAYRLGSELPLKLDPQEFGQRLFAAIFQQEILIGLNRSLAQTEQTGEGLRLRLRLNDAPALAALPWEYLYGPPPYGFFALSRQTPLVRFLELPQTQRALQVERPLHILALISDPEDLSPRLDVEREWQRLQQELGPLQAEGIITLECLSAETLAALQRRLTQAPAVHVLHVISHGYFDTGRRTAGLVLEDDQHRQQFVDAEAIGALLYDHTSLRLLFLNACEGSRSDGTDPFTGLAQHLVQRRLPAVIAMQYKVTDDAAIQLAAAFYRALAAGDPVDAALAEARKTLYTGRQRLEWGTPVLFLRTPDARLFDLPPLAAETPGPGATPYQGLPFFDVGDRDRFFGREALTAELVQLLGERRFLAVVGASGSGKSSLVRAGLVPALQHPETLANTVQPPRGSSRWPVHIITPTAHPLESLAAALTQQSESVTATATLIDDLRRDPRSLHLFIRRLLAQNGADRLLLVVDQFEETFTLCRSKEERQHFVSSLLTAAAGDGVTTVVITLRADFYAHCAEFADLRTALERSQRFIGPMSQEELRRAIEAPARLGGWDFEPGLVDLLLQEVGDEPGALPLLSHALLETWQRRRGRTLTFAGYQAAGRVQGAIAATAERTLRALTPDQQAIARTIFLRLTELGEGAQDTRRRASLAELLPAAEGRELAETVLTTLATARLVTTDQGEAQVAHEALIRAWPTLREWLQDDREGLRIHRHLTEAAEAWLALGQDPSELYRGARLDQALAWAQGHAGDLNEQEQAFLTRSQAERQRQIEEKERIGREREAARQRELEQAQQLAAEQAKRAAAEANRTRTFRLAAVIALILTLLALAAAGLAVNRQQAAQTSSNNAATRAVEAQNAQSTAQAQSTRADQEANAANLARATSDANAAVAATRAAEAQTAQVQAEITARIAQSRALAAASQAAASTNVMRAWLLAIEAGRAANTDQAFAALNAQDAAIGQSLLALTHDGSVDGAQWNSDESRILSWSGDNTVRLWDAASGDLLHTLTHDGSVDGAQWNSDESRILSWSGDGEVRLWDAASGDLLHTLTHDGSVDGAQWNSDESRILSWSRDNTVRLWDAASGDLLHTLTHDGSVDGAQWNSDDSHILSWSGEFVNNTGEVHLWEAASGALLHTLTHDDDVWGAQWNSDESRILSWSGDGEVRLWDAQTGVPLQTFSGDGSDVSSARWNQAETQVMLTTAGGYVYRYYTDMDDLLDAACTRAARNLTWQEWQQYLPGEPYHQTCRNLPIHPSVSASALTPATTPTP